MAWTLIAFPLLTGGLWIKRPGLHLELTELAIPVVIVAGLAWVSHIDLRRTSFVRTATWLWRTWQKSLAQNPGVKLIGYAVVVGGLWAWASCRRHQSYGSGAADLGIFTNAIWNLAHGHGYVSSLKEGINLFADHQSPIFWLFAPIYRVFGSPETLLIIQAMSLALGAVPLYWIAVHYELPAPWCPALPLLYWAYLPLRNANAFDFHPETLMLPLFLGALAGLFSDKRPSKLWGAFAFFLALGAKESAGPVAVGIGLAWLLGAGPPNQKSHRILGVAAVMAGLAVFEVDTKWAPRWFGHGYAYASLYAGFGSSITELVFSPLLHPGEFWGRVLNLPRLRFLLGTLAPLGFIPLLGGRALLAALPGYAMLFLSEGDHRVALIYHYAIEPAVGLFWALIPGLCVITERGLPKPFHRISPALWIVFFALVCFGRSAIYRVRVNSPTEHHQWLTHDLLPCISPLPLAASGALVPHLANRPWIHHLPHIAMPDHQRVDCALFDPSVNNWPMKTEEFNGILPSLQSEGYATVYSCGEVRLLQSTEARKAARECLSCVPRCP